MNKASFRAALITSALFISFAPAGLASAQTLATADPAGDVWRIVEDPESGEPTYEEAGSQPNVDLTRSVVKHTSTKVVVRAHYASLKRRAGALLFVTRVRTNEGLKRDIVVENFGRARGSHELSKPKNGDVVRCGRMTHSIDYTADTVTVAVPRSCLSRPRWVQATHLAVGFTETDIFLDHGHMAGLEEKAIWTARIRRG